MRDSLLLLFFVSFFFSNDVLVVCRPQSSRHPLRRGRSDGTSTPTPQEQLGPVGGVDRATQESEIAFHHRSKTKTAAFETQLPAVARRHTLERRDEDVATVTLLQLKSRDDGDVLPTLRSQQDDDPNTVCGQLGFDRQATFSCPNGTVFKEVVFVSDQPPTGACGKYSNYRCVSVNVEKRVKDTCVGKADCVLAPTRTWFAGWRWGCNYWSVGMYFQMTCATKPDPLQIADVKVQVTPDIAEEKKPPFLQQVWPPIPPYEYCPEKENDPRVKVPIADPLTPPAAAAAVAQVAALVAAGKDVELIPHKPPIYHENLAGCGDNCATCSPCKVCTACNLGYMLGGGAAGCVPVCNQNCIDCASPNVCRTCQMGYGGPTCAPLCPDVCESCVAPNVCARCRTGYIGPTCIPTGPVISLSCTDTVLSRRDVFAVQTEYWSEIGCYIDSWWRDVSDYQWLWWTNRERCASTCKSQKYKYFSLQYSSQCFCGNSYGRYGSAPSYECDYPCWGNYGQRCGGTWRNLVYSLDYTTVGPTYNVQCPSGCDSGDVIGCAPTAYAAWSPICKAARTVGPNTNITFDGGLYTLQINGSNNNLGSCSRNGVTTSGLWYSDFTMVLSWLGSIPTCSPNCLACDANNNCVTCQEGYSRKMLEAPKPGAANPIFCEKDVKAPVR